MHFLKSFFLLLLGFFVVLSAVGCKESDDEGRGGIVYLEPGDSAVRTVLVYIMAENDLSGNVRSDLNEMIRGANSIPDNCYLLAFVDDMRLPYICRIYNNMDGVTVRDTVLKYNEDFYSTDTVRLREVVTWVLDEYPSDNFGLVLWSHGTGWVYDVNRTRSIGVDNGLHKYENGSYTSKWMEVDELAAVLESLPVKSEFVFYDACFMQCVEAAYAMRNATEWLVGSPAELPANGAPYHKIMSSLFSFPFNADSLIYHYKSGYPEYAGVALSAIKTSALEHLAEVTADIVPAYFSRSYIVNDSTFSYLPGGSSNGKYPEYCDMNAQMQLRLPAELYAIWKMAFDEAVPYKVASKKWMSAIKNPLGEYYDVDQSLYSGVSMFVPRDWAEYVRFNDDFRKTEWYTAAGWYVTGW